jgi:hypothetical protein
MRPLDASCLPTSTAASHHMSTTQAASRRAQYTTPLPTSASRQALAARARSAARMPGAISSRMGGPAAPASRGTWETPTWNASPRPAVRTLCRRAVRAWGLKRAGLIVAEGGAPTSYWLRDSLFHGSCCTAANHKTSSTHLPASCGDKVCGENATCSTVAFGASICSCMAGYNGNPDYGCSPNPPSKLGTHPFGQGHGGFTCSCVLDRRTATYTAQSMTHAPKVHCGRCWCLLTMLWSLIHKPAGGGAFSGVCPFVHPRAWHSHGARRSHTPTLNRTTRIDPCVGYPCGVNAVCSSLLGVPSCACIPGYSGNPYSPDGCSLASSGGGGSRACVDRASQRVQGGQQLGT